MWSLTRRLLEGTGDGWRKESVGIVGCGDAAHAV
jgi:hypothetical protein